MVGWSWTWTLTIRRQQAGSQFPTETEVIAQALAGVQQDEMYIHLQHSKP